MKNVRWSVSLSNGETLYEEKGDYKTVAGELSPWQRLLRYIETTGVTITSLSLYAENGMRWNLPSAGKDPKFAEFANCSRPEAYRFFRKVGVDKTGPRAGIEDRFTVAEAVFLQNKLQIWVDEKTLVSWARIEESLK